MRGFGLGIDDNLRNACNDTRPRWAVFLCSGVGLDDTWDCVRLWEYEDALLGDAYNGYSLSFRILGHEAGLQRGLTRREDALELLRWIQTRA